MVDDWEDEMTDGEKADSQHCYIWCVGMLHELEERGLVKCSDGDRLSPKGIAIFDQLKATGWVPPEDMALAALTQMSGSTEVAEQMWLLIDRMRNDQE